MVTFGRSCARIYKWYQVYAVQSSQFRDEQVRPWGQPLQDWPDVLSAAPSLLYQVWVFFFFFGIVKKGALRLLPPSEVWLLPTFSSTFLPLSWVDRSSGLLYCLLAWASFSSLIEPFLDISLSELPKDKTQHCEWCPLRLSRTAKASPWRTTSRALKSTHLGSTFQRSVLYSFGCSGSWLWHTGCSLRCASSLLAGAGFSLIVAHRLSDPVEYGIFVPNQGLHLHPLPLENRFLTTGPPGKFQVLHSKEDTQRVFRKALAWTAHD